MSLLIRPLADADLESAAHVLSSAFQRSSHWVNELRLYRGVQPDGYFGAYHEEMLVGMVGSIVYSNFAYIGMMGVHQQFQRHGIGIALMQHLLKWQDEKDIPHVQLDASEAGQPMYEKLGFVARERVFVLERQAGFPIKRPEQIESIQSSDLAALAEMDAQIFGADRSRVFSALSEAYPHRAFFSRDAHGQITGYLFMQEMRIGPWVMLEAGDEEALLQAALSLDIAGILSVVVPETNQRALELLLGHGFEIARTNRHMVRGSATTIGQRDKVYAQTSLSLG
jgi:ribosomal protein S18 acetylase RimI-like enzyme